MASKLTAFITRWLARRPRRRSPESEPVKGAVPPPDPVPAAAQTPASDGTTAPESVPDRGTPEQAPPFAGEPAAEDRPGPVASDVSGERAAPDGADAPAEAGVSAPDGAPHGATDPVDENEPVLAAGETGEAEAAPAAEQAPAPANDGPKIVTVVSLAPHTGGRTLAAALAGRTQGTGWEIRATGPGLTRAAFAGMLTGIDALVLVSGTDPAATAVLDANLQWLEANNRPQLHGKTVFVLNHGAARAADGSDPGAVQLPADLSRPVVMLPADAALVLPATGPRALRRATRRALDHLIDEISTILQEQ